MLLEFVILETVKNVGKQEIQYAALTTQPCRNQDTIHTSEVDNILKPS